MHPLKHIICTSQRFSAWYEKGRKHLRGQWHSHRPQRFPSPLRLHPASARHDDVPPRKDTVSVIVSNAAVRDNVTIAEDCACIWLPAARVAYLLGGQGAHLDDIKGVDDESGYDGRSAGRKRTSP